MRALFEAIRSMVAGFLSWWGQELAGMLPSRLLRMSGPALPTRIVSIEDRGLRLVDARGGPTPAAEPAGDVVLPVAEMLERLTREAHGPAPLKVGLRLPLRSCFARRVELPRGAVRDFPRLLALDLERATPFKPRDVRSAYFIESEPSQTGKVGIRQLVIKRSAIDSLIAKLEQAGVDVVRVDCWAEDGVAALPINFLDCDTPIVAAAPRSMLLPKVLAAGAVAMTCFAAYALVDRYDTALADVQAQTARLKVKAQSVRETAARSQALLAEINNFRQLRTATPSKAMALEELTRLLPDTAWVTDLKIDGATVDISGIANSAVALVPILERSTFFVDATSTAPLTFDQREGKERFSIRVRIRNSAAPDANKQPGAVR